MRESKEFLPEQAIEGAENTQIVFDNVDLMQTRMEDLLVEESYGRGSRVQNGKPEPIGGANCYVNPNSGSIISFGNYLAADKSVDNGKNIHMTFPVTQKKVIEYKGKLGRSQYIILLKDLFQKEGFSERAKMNLILSVRKYNDPENYV